MWFTFSASHPLRAVPGPVVTLGQPPISELAGFTEAKPLSLRSDSRPHDLCPVRGADMSNLYPWAVGGTWETILQALRCLNRERLDWVAGSRAY